MTKDEFLSAFAEGWEARNALEWRPEIVAQAFAEVAERAWEDVSEREEQDRAGYL